MNRSFHKIFGDINGENDDLLFECKVRKINIDFTKPIITGRWGSGKTAQMLLQNETQINYLKSIKKELSKIWYLSERDILQDSIVELFDTHKENVHKFESVLRNMWKAEIIRIYVILLNCYLDRYKSKIDTSSTHWKEIIKVNKRFNIHETTSKYLGIIAKLIFSDRKNEIKELENLVDEVLSEKTYSALKVCLQELYDNNCLIPQVVVEPIETPHSHFEKTRSLAASVVRALLDVYMSEFYPSKDNPFNVRLVIPWHRMTKEVKFPQKTTDIEGFVSWTRQELKTFIENRIEWEFKAVGRKLTRRQHKGIWYEIFDEKIKNGWVKQNFEEDTFDYFLRHTHFRARDLINLCKKCVEHAFNSGKYNSTDDVLKEGFISSKIIKETFHEYNTTAAKELLEEAKRKYRDFENLAETLYRLPLVFSRDILEGRLQTYNIQENVDETIKKLWESGFVGITIQTDNSDHIDNILPFAGVEGRKDFEKYTRWTWYFYNTNKTPIDLLRVIETIGCTDFGLCLHPKLFESYTPIVHDKLMVPIGV